MRPAVGIMDRSRQVIGLGHWALSVRIRAVFPIHCRGCEQAADFHHQQRGIEIIGRRLRGEAVQRAMRVDDRGEPGAGRTAHLLCDHRAGKLDRRELAFARGGAARSPRPVRRAVRNARRPRPGIRRISTCNGARSCAANSSAAPGDPPAALTASARAAGSSPGISRARNALHLALRRIGEAQHPGQRERIVASSRPGRCATSRKNVPRGGSSRLFSSALAAPFSRSSAGADDDRAAAAQRRAGGEGVAASRGSGRR